MVLRFLLVSDTHVDYDNIRRLLQKVNGQSYDAVLHTGDLANIPSELV